MQPLPDSLSRRTISLIYNGERIIFGDWFAVEDGEMQVPPFAIPKRLKDMTDEQISATVVYLSGRSLKELRRWQDTIFRQQETGGSDFAVENLGEMERHLAAAVHMKEFPA